MKLIVDLMVLILGAYITNLDDYSDIRTHWVAL